MRKFLLLAGIFTVLACNTAKAERYYEKDGYYYKEQPRYVRRVEYVEDRDYQREQPRYRNRVEYVDDGEYQNPQPRYQKVKRSEVREVREPQYRQREYVEYEESNKIRPYIGLDVVKSSLGGVDLEYAYQREDYDGYFEDSFTAISGVVGAKINKNFGIEAFYQKSSEEDKDTNRRGYDDRNDIAVGSDETSTISYTSYGLDAIGYLPVNHDFELLASLGLAQYNFETSAIAYATATDGVNIVTGTFTNKQDFDSLGIRFGVGLQYNINDNISIRGMYRYVKLNDDEYLRSLTELSLGLRYMF